MNYTHEQIDIITRHYLVCALWSSTDENGEPLDDGHDIDDIFEETKAQAREDISDFLRLLDREGVEWRDDWTLEQFGHDFWLTRNGHGAGFWDRAPANQPSKRQLGDTLSEWAETMGEVYLYVGDDGKVYA